MVEIGEESKVQPTVSADLSVELGDLVQSAESPTSGNETYPIHATNWTECADSSLDPR